MIIGQFDCRTLMQYLISEVVAVGAVVNAKPLPDLIIRNIFITCGTL
jgi:hypothetical protein